MDLSGSRDEQSDRPASPADLRAEPFRRARAIGVGVTADQLRGPSFVHLRRDLYVHVDADVNDDLEARAWMTLMPDRAAMYGATAAWWLGLPVPRPREFHVIVPAGGAVPRRRPGLATHEGLGEHDVQVVRGLRVTTAERTWLDLSLVLSPIELVVVGDAMVRAAMTVPARLIAAADSARGRRAIVQTRKQARMVRDRVDSPPETRLRLAMIAGGLPCPAVNPDVYDEAGGWIGRPDLAYLELKISIQYEGDVHRVDKWRWRSDVSRDAVLVDHGWEVIRVTADDLRRPWLLCQRIRRAMDRQRVRLGLA